MKFIFRKFSENELILSKFQVSAANNRNIENVKNTVLRFRCFHLCLSRKKTKFFFTGRKIFFTGSPYGKVSFSQPCADTQKFGFIAAAGKVNCSLSRNLKADVSFRSDDGLTLETSAFEFHYSGQFTSSTLLIYPNGCVLLPHCSTSFYF